MKTSITFYDWRKRTPMYDHTVFNLPIIPRKDEIVLIDEVEHEVIHVEHKFYMEEGLQEINIYLHPLL